MSVPTTKLSIRTPTATVHVLEALAEREDRSLSYIINRALANYAARTKKHRAATS